MAQEIVQVNVSLLLAPAPVTLQQTGAVISQGATTKANGSLTLITSPADLTPILAVADSFSTAIWTAGVVTVTIPVAGPLPAIGQTFLTTISGVVVTGYNGTFTATVTSTTTFTYPLAVNPGSAGATGTYSAPGVTELTAMVSTFFAQGRSTPVYVLELGSGTEAAGVTALTTWLNNNPLTVYAFLVPRNWASESTFPALVTANNAPGALVYFWITATDSTYTPYKAQKSAIVLVEAATVPPTEFSLASAFQHSLTYRPSSTNRVTPFAFSFLFGVTPYPTIGNGAQLATFKTDGVNVVGTGAEGGLTNTILYWGTTMDNRDWTFWFNIDWMNLNSQRVLANTVIDGSNSPANPLIYNQEGINRLQSVEASLCSSAITFGVATGNLTLSELDGPALTTALDTGVFTDDLVVNAVPFVQYAQDNPSDFATGVYAGLTVVFIVARGFTQIILNLVASDLITV